MVVDHLLFKPANEVLGPLLLGQGIKGILSGEYLCVQQAPEGVVREPLAHMRRGREQQQMGNTLA
jgi:hypothetical protein